MTEASLRYENEQLKRKLLQTQEERDRAMSNCHELWKRLNSLISLAASTTASYPLSSSGLPTSPSDSYDSRSKSTSPNSSAASLNDSLLSTTTSSATTTQPNNNNNNNNQTNTTQSATTATTTTTTATSAAATTTTTTTNGISSSATGANINSNNINKPNGTSNNNIIKGDPAAVSQQGAVNGQPQQIVGAHTNSGRLNVHSSSHHHHHRHHLLNGTNNHTPLNLKSITAIKTNSSLFQQHANSLNQHLNQNNNNNNNVASNLTTSNNINSTSTPSTNTNTSINSPSNHHLTMSQGNLNNSNNHHSPSHQSAHLQSPLNLNKSSLSAIKDINNNHPLIAEVAKVTTVGEIEEIAPGQFKCRYCDKTFDRIFSVHRHERVHTGFKPCVCKACGRGFSEKRNLRHHIIRFHSDGTGRELLKRNRNKSACMSSASMVSQAQAQHQAKQQIKQLSAAASFLQQQQQQQQQQQMQQSKSSSQNSTGSSSSPSSNGSSPQHHSNTSIHTHHHHHSLIDTNNSLLSGNHNNNNNNNNNSSTQNLISATSSQITATINRLQNSLKNEPIDTSGLSALGAAAAVITVSSSSSRRRKSKPSKKINY